VSVIATGFARMQHITAICLDLDDTLWDLAPVLRRAEQRTHAWLHEHYPRVTARFGIGRIRRMRETVAAENPGRGHDLLYLRRETFIRLAADAGYPEAMADEALAVFQAARNDVELFDDVVPALTRVRERRALFALTNGNADLAAIGLAEMFRGVFSAAELGVAKPDPGFFAAFLEHTGIEPGAAVHIGDDPQNDILAAREAGMTTIWINRAARDWPPGVTRPDHELASLDGLADLFDS